MSQTPDNSLQLNKIGKETLIALLTYRTKTAAAQALSISRDTLYSRIAKYGLDKMIDEIPNQALQTLKLGSERAAEVLVGGLDTRDKMEAAKAVLDRVLPKRETIGGSIKDGEKEFKFIISREN